MFLTLEKRLSLSGGKRVDLFLEGAFCSEEDATPEPLEVPEAELWVDGWVVPS